MEIIRDVTEDVTLKEEIRQSKEKLENIVKGMFDGLMVLDQWIGDWRFIRRKIFNLIFNNQLKDGYIIKPFERNEVMINAANALRRREVEIRNRLYRENLERMVQERKDLRKALEGIF